MTPLRVDAAVRRRFPGLRVVAVVAGDLDLTVPRDEVAAELARAWAAAARDAAAFAGPGAHPRVRPWRRALGADVPSSVEMLLRRALEGAPPPLVDPLVDLATTVSVRHVVPVAVLDLDAVDGDVALRLTRGGEPFHAPGAAPVAVGRGEIAYTDAREVLIRHAVSQPSRTAAVTPATRRALLAAAVLPELDRPVAGAVLAHLRVALRRDLAADVAGAIVP